MNLWAFRFILWYICILLVQPQNRFTFLWPLHIANLAFIIGAGMHIFSCLESRRPLLRLGPATILTFVLLFFTTLSQYFGTYQISPAWNPYLDIMVKNSLLLIMIEAMADSVERVWAVQMTALFATLWWVKGGLRLAAVGATYAGDRLMGAAVSLIDNPNGFAYFMCIVLPLYLYAYQQGTRKWIKIFFLACALAAVYIVFQTGSRTGMLTLIAIGIFLVPYYGRKHISAMGVIILAIVLMYPLTGEKNKARFRTIPNSIASFFYGKADNPSGRMTQDEQSADERRMKNIDTWALIKENLIFGVGINPDQTKYVGRFPMAQGQVHCEILMAGRQMGLIGMGIYVGYLSIIILGGIWCWRHAKHWPAVRDLGWTFVLQGVAIVVGGSFGPIPWHPFTLLLAGSASALIGVLKREEERTVIAGL